MVRPCVTRRIAELAVSGLALMYPAFDLEHSLRAIMDISARAISLADRPRRAIRVTSVRMRREDRPPSRLIFSQTSAGSWTDYFSNDYAAWS